ncbi:MAG: hypothetical protein ACTTKL_09710 [Treponema sp.]
MKKKRFKDELRQSLIAHSLIPSAAAVFVFLLCAYTLWRHSLAAEIGRTAAAFAQEMDTALENYADFLASFSGVEPLRAAKEADYAAGFNEKLYRFLNAQSVKGTFYLTDSSFDLRLSSEYAPRTAELSRWKNAQFVLKLFFAQSAFRNFFAVR